MAAALATARVDPEGTKKKLEAGAWNLYMRTWRPGKPHRSTWPALYAEALAEVTA